MARPSEYNIEVCILICEEIAKGGNIMQVLDSNDKYPSWSTFRRWKRDNEELRTLYINSQQDKAEALEKEMDDYRSMLLSKEIDASTYNTLVQTLKWKMSKYYAKMYGDKTDITSGGEKINTNIAILNIDPFTEDGTNDSTS
jgi:hypothetical protein